MLSDFLFSKFRAIFEDRINSEIAMARNAERAKICDEREQNEITKLQSMIGAPVISISNEWQNPIVGILEDVVVGKGSPIPIIHDFVTDARYWCMGVTVPFTQQRLAAILKLDPYEACSLMFQNCNPGVWDKNKLGSRDTAEEILQKLRDSGFPYLCTFNQT